MPSSVPAIISSSDESPGSRPTLVMRTIGSRAGPSARTMPPDGRPTSGRRVAARQHARPSGRRGRCRPAGRPRPRRRSRSCPWRPGRVASAVICISSLPKRRLPSWAGSSHEVPANAASHPRMRSSSTAWPTDSWICSATWSESRITVVTPVGQGGRRQQRLRLLGHAARRWRRGRGPRTSSQPCVPYWPRTPGYDRRWVSPSPMAVASTTAPHSTMRWSMRLPSLDANHFSVSHAW